MSKDNSVEQQNKKSTVQSIETKMRQTKNTLSGIGWFVLAGFCSAALSTITKILVTRYHVFQITFLHAFLAFPLYIPLLLKTKYKVLKTPQVHLHFVRGAINVLCAVSWFYALKYSPISEAVSIKFITPIMITFLAIIFFKERPHLYNIMALMTGFIGILLIIQPEFDTFKMGYFLVLLSAVLSSLYHLLVKKLTAKDSADTVTIYFIITMSLFTLPMALPVFKMMTLADFALTVLLAVVTTGYIKFMAVAYSKTDISILQPFDFMRLVFASILAFIIFGKVTGPWTVVGAIIILSSTSFLTIVRKYEYQLEKCRKQIEELLKTRMNFFRNINHELRAPLNAILGYSQVIMEKNEDRGNAGISQTYNYAQQINCAGEHLLGLINNILDISKIDSDKMTLYETEFSLGQDLWSCINMMAIRAEQKSVRINYIKDEISLGENNDIIIKADQQKIKQILINILSNAIKYNHVGGAVDIRLSLDSEKENIVLKIKNTGQGMKKEEIPKIFEEYMQTTEGVQRGEGTGLGLPIAKKLVELHKGSLKFDSDEEQGAEITITLPKECVIKITPDVCDLKKCQKVECECNERESSTKKDGAKYPDLKILLVDDDRMLLDLHSRILRKTITENVIPLDGGRKLFEILEKEKPDLLILDEHLEVKEKGSELARKIKESSNTDISSIKIIMLTADVFTKDIENIMKTSKADAFVPKPFNVNDMVNKVAYVMGFLGNKNNNGEI